LIIDLFPQDGVSLIDVVLRESITLNRKERTLTDVSLAQIRPLIGSSEVNDVGVTDALEWSITLLQEAMLLLTQLSVLNLA